MVRTKDKKAKGDDAFTKKKQKIGAKKLAPATATRAEVHARTLRIVKPRDEVITPENINRKRNANELLTSKADASADARKAATAGGAGWEKHRPDRSLQENLLGAAHYREATRASSFTALNTTVDHFASSISPTQFMQLLNVTLGAVTDTGNDVREKALALFMKLLKLFPPPMTSDGVRHIMTYIRISLTHAQPGVRRSGIKMLGAFARQWPGAIRKAYAGIDSNNVGNNSNNGAAGNNIVGGHGANAALITPGVPESSISQALSTHAFVSIGGDCGSAATTSSFLRTSDGLARQGGVLNGTVGTHSYGQATFISDSNNPKATGGVEVSSIYDTTVRAKTFDIEQILEWATDVASNAPVNQQHRMLPVIATLLEEVLPYRDHVAADVTANLGASVDADADGSVSQQATVTLPVAFVERYFRKFASKWAMQWKEMMELGYKMFRDAIVVERITAVGRCFAACTIYLHRHGRLFTGSGYGRNGLQAANDQNFLSAQNYNFDARWMLRELFLYKVPFTMKELTSGAGSKNSGESSETTSYAPKMNTADALLRGPLMAPKAAASIAAAGMDPSRSKAAKKLSDKGPLHLTIVPTARNPTQKDGKGKVTKDASQLTVFDAMAAVANVSQSRLRIAEVLAWCLLPIASDKQEQLKCNNVINGITTVVATPVVGSKRGRNDTAKKGGNNKKKAARTETTSENKDDNEAEDEGVDQAALGKPDLEADAADSDGEVDLDEKEEEADKTTTNKQQQKDKNSNNKDAKSTTKGNDNVAQAKRLVRAFIESAACPLTSAVQLLRAMLYMYPHLYPTLGMPLITTLLKRAQPTIAAVTPITIAAPTKQMFVGGLNLAKKATEDKSKAKAKKVKKDDDDSSDYTDSDEDEEEEDENSKAAKERNASAASGSQSGRDLKELVGLVANAMSNRYVLLWPSKVTINVTTASAATGANTSVTLSNTPIAALGDLLRDHIPKTLFCLRNYAAHPSTLPPAHSPAYNNAGRRQIAMAHERGATLGRIMRSAVQTYHDAVSMKHPALYGLAATAAEEVAASSNNSDALLKKSLSALIEIRMKNPKFVAEEAAESPAAAEEFLVMKGPLTALDDPVLVNMAKGTISYL